MEHYSAGHHHSGNLHASLRTTERPLMDKQGRCQSSDKSFNRLKHPIVGRESDNLLHVRTISIIRNRLLPAQCINWSKLIPEPGYDITPSPWKIL